MNNTQLEIFYSQRCFVETATQDLSFVSTLLPRQKTPWHWPSKDYPKEICIALEDCRKDKDGETEDANWQWSNGFSIDQLGDFAVKIPLAQTDRSSQKQHYICRVHITFERATFFIVFNEESKEFPPYRLENFTMANVAFFQKVVSLVARSD
jgi:hypothetical protein